MNIHEFTQRILKPIGVELFPASGNLYFKHWRIGYAHISQNRTVQFVKVSQITPVPGIDETMLENYKNTSVELKARVVLHDIPIKDRYLP